MSSYLNTEIGRMRCEEMVARGMLYQQLEAAKRERTSVTRKVRRRSILRVPALATLATLMLVALSSAAAAYPAAPGSDAGSGSVPAETTVVQFDRVLTINLEWVLAVALAGLVTLGLLLLRRRHTFARA